MVNWMESNSTVRASHSYESTSHAWWSTQSSSSRADSTNRSEKSKSKSSRRKLEECIWSVLGEFNGSTSKRRKKIKKVMEVIDKYCRFRSTPKSASASSEATKPSSSAKTASAVKTPSATKPSTSASKPKHATKILISSKSSDVAKPSNAVCPFSAPKLPKTPKPATAKKSLVAAKSKPQPSPPRKDNVKQGDKLVDELQKELQRLADSEGFVTSYPKRCKRVPKPVHRFSVSIYDENRARRCARRADRRSSNNIDIDRAVEVPKKKKKPAENEMVFEVQQQKTISETTSTIVSEVTGTGALATRTNRTIVTSTQTDVRNFNYKGTFISHFPMFEVKSEK